MSNLDGLSPKALTAYRHLEELSGGPLDVISGYRSPEHNARVGGAKNSQHLHGNAIDVNVRDMPRADRIEMIRQARQSGFSGIGVYDNTLHFDVGPERAWGPSYSRDSLPEWALAGLNPLARPVANSAAPNQLTTEAAMNKLALLQAMPRWRNSLRAEDFMNGV